MSESPCTHCNASLVESVICWDCAKTLRRLLVDLPWWLRRLAETAYGEAKTAPRGAVKSATCDTPGLPLNSRASDLRTTAYRVLEPVRAALLPIETEGLYPEGVAVALAAAISDLMAYEWAGEFITELQELRDEAETVVDLPVDRILAGMCPNDIEDVGRCGAAVYCVEGDEAAICGDCGGLAIVEELRSEGLRQIHNDLRSAADMFRISKWLRRDVPRATFYRLLKKAGAHATRLVDHCELYRWADVEPLIDERDALMAARRAVAKFARDWDEAHEFNALLQPVLTDQHAYC